jgi:hypothetical protein
MDEVKWVQINALVPLPQRELLKQRAREAELTISQLINKLITSSIVEVTPGISAQLKELNSWLGRINSNINMLAHHANKHREKADAQLICFQLAQIGRDTQQLTTIAGELKKTRRSRKKAEASA